MHILALLLIISTAFSSDSHWRHSRIRDPLDSTPDAGKQLAAKVAEEKLAAQAVDCTRPATENDAMAFIEAHKKEIFEAAKLHSQDEEYDQESFMGVTKNPSYTKSMLGLESEVWTRTKSMSRTLTKRLFIEGAKDKDTLEYIRGVAYEYVKSINDGCKMCGDEAKIALRRSEFMAKLGLNRDSNCRPKPNGPPEIIILYENHFEQEQGAAGTAKRGVISDVTGSANDSILLLTEAMSDNSPPVDQARLLDFFKLPVNKSNLNNHDIPTGKDARLQGLDNDRLISVRSLQLALEAVEKKEIKAGGFKTSNNREAFFNFLIGNPSARELMNKIALYGASAKYAPATTTIGKSGLIREEDSNVKIFGKSSRLPMD